PPYVFRSDLSNNPDPHEGSIMRITPRPSLHRTILALLSTFFALLLARTTFAQSRAAVAWMVGGHAAPVAGVVYSPDGNFVFSASIDGTIKQWRRSVGRLIASFSIPSSTFPGLGGLNGVRFMPDGQTLLATGGGGVFIFRLSDGALLQFFVPGEFTNGAALSPDGSLLACSGAFTGFDEGVAFFRTS